MNTKFDNSGFLMYCKGSFFQKISVFFRPPPDDGKGEVEIMWTTFFVLVALFSLITFFVSLFHVPSGHVVVLEWSVWIPGILRPADPDHVVARDDEQGVEARHHMPGWNLRWFVRWFARRHKFPFVSIPDDQIMIVTAADGEPRPSGQVFGAWLSPACFADGERFLREHGQRGPQMWIIGPGGTCAFNYKLFTHEMIPRTLFLPREVKDPVTDAAVSAPTFGLVTALIGEEIQEGPGQRLLGRHVDGHNNFQDIRVFLIGGGQRGPQQDVVEAAGFFHPLAFRVETQVATLVREGSVGIRISNIGDAPEAMHFLPQNDPVFVFDPTGTGTGTIHQRQYVQILHPNFAGGRRGIHADVYAPGLRNISPWVERVVRIDTTEVRVCFDRHKENLLHPEAIRGPMQRVISAEGYEVNMHVEIIIRMRAELAPMLVALSGDLHQTIRDFIAPTAERCVREIASRTPIETFITERGVMGGAVELALRVLFGERYLDLVSFNIVEIEFLDDEVKERLRASTQFRTLGARRRVEKRRRGVEQLAGEADAEREAQVLERLTHDPRARELAGAVIAVLRSVLNSKK